VAGLTLRHGVGDELLALAAASSPSIDRTLRRWGDRSLRDLLASFAGVAPATPLQPRDDLWAVVQSSLAGYHSDVVAAAVVADLRADPVVPTSNHFGIDTVADSVQGTLLFSLRPGASRRSPTAVVFGFGSVSMNNFSYPLGLRLYDSVPHLPQRLPIFPNRLKQVVVAAAPPFDEDMITRARSRLASMDQLSSFSTEAADQVLADVFLPAADATTYAEQSARVNAALWSRTCPERSPGGAPFRDKFAEGGPPRFAQVPVEAVCAQLLQHDLAERGSLLHRLFFDTPVRERLLRRLDGAAACWRLADDTTGTLFFWGISAKGRRFPLRLVDGRLVGGDFSVIWEPGAIMEALEDGRLLPSLLTCFAVLAFARGLGCVGGYYQANYLPVMQAGIVHALGSGAMADAVARVPADLCLAGLQGLVREMADGSVLPVGPVELGGRGTGIDTAALSVRDASLLALTEVLGELVPNDRLPDDWARQLATENGRRWRRYRGRPAADRAI
jgi:hypothetical protein